MTTQVTATFVGGMLKPDQRLPLADHSRVRLTIEPMDAWLPEAATAAWEALKAQLRERPLHFGGQRFTRDELHEREKGGRVMLCRKPLNPSCDGRPLILREQAKQISVARGS